MIKTIKLKFGRGSGSAPEVIGTTPVTVFVGPNNSGKSKALAEINYYCSTGQQSTTDVILDKIEFDTFMIEIAEEKVQKLTLQPHLMEKLLPDHIIVGKRGVRDRVSKHNLLNAFLNTNSQSQQFCQWYLVHNTLMLDGKSRINLIDLQYAGDLQAPPETSFQVLFRDDVKRKEVRRIIYDAFNKYFVIDPTSLGQLRLRLSSRPPTMDMEERGIHDEAVQFHAQAFPVEQASDGVKAFTGIITEIIAGDPAVILIDEPEAFLHPSLSFKLGKEIASSSLGSEKRLFVSTHSPNFVMGCIQSGAPVNIVRLTYRSEIATARILSNIDILHLMRNPLLRSTGVLGGLFYEFIVVTESDADRAFYQEINERLLRYKPELGIPNCLFLNAQNKQTVQIIIKPLRELGIPSVGIVDVDILKDGGRDWTNFLKGGFIPELEHQPLGGLRHAVKQKIDETGKNMKKDGGVTILSGSDKEAANNLFDKLAEYGLFVVRNGELESWLSSLGATGHGPGWLINIFEKMGEDPESQDYLKPSDEDVWLFFGEIKTWFMNPSRKGIPS
ncbi:MAG: AAA family ATPase [Synechococcales cyanobacterium K44_A2020_017]|nr:AAA family ATPase [Synechococcales cyanobacterium K32_A2020_035]MBF2093495.1 AAA family ATPase [Synechococcales cyanobacterium K44_A2020_017]